MHISVLKIFFLNKQKKFINKTGTSGTLQTHNLNKNYPTIATRLSGININIDINTN